MEGIYVIKRNGEKEPLQIYKTQKFIYWGCEGIKSVDPQAVLEAANIQFTDGIKTDDITKVIINATVNMIQEETNYQFVAARYVLFDVRKRAYGGFEPISWKEYVERGVAAGMLDKSLREAYTDEELDEINSMLDHSRDFNFTYGGIEQWRMKYCLQNRYTKKIYESPQMTYMRVAAALFSGKKKDRLAKIKQAYDSASLKAFSLPTPIMAGAGTPTRQFSSCVGIKIGDDLDSIIESGGGIVRYASRKAGLGVDGGRMRALGQPIRGGDAIHTGLIPFVKKFRGDLKSCAQGSIRGASCTFYFPFWHLEFPELVVLKNNKGIEENRERHLDYGVQISKYFFELAKDPNADMYLFSPEQVPDLYESFFKDQKAFARLYKEYGQRTDITKKTVKAKDMMKLLLGERTDTGRIYLFFVDNANDNGPFDLDTIYHSNLCFSGDTRVQVIDDISVPIETIYEAFGQGGEIMVWSANYVDGDWISEPKYARVFKTGYRKLVKVTLDNGDSFRCTPDHPIALKDGTYKEAKDLVGYSLVTTEDDDIKVVSVQDDRWEDVYDLNVDDNHNFFINLPNTENVLVHNCCEIALPSKPFNSKFDEEGRIFLCTLASMNWGAFKNPEEMRIHCHIIVEMLDELLEYQDYPQHQARLATDDYRPLGIGVVNLAYFLAKRDMKYGDKESLAEVKKWIEHQVYYLTEASVKLAKDDVPCREWKNLCYAKGVFPWEKRSKHVDELTSFEPSENLDWESLRSEVVKHGIRNACLTAEAPTETSSQPLGATNGIEPPFDLISIKVSKDGTIVHVVPEYKKLKKKYETKWTMGQDGCLNYLKVNAVLAAYIDQALSTNTFYNPNDFEGRKIPFSILFRDIYLGAKYGIKSNYYSNLWDGGVEKKQSLPTLQSAPIEDEVCEGCTV